MKGFITACQNHDKIYTVYSPNRPPFMPDENRRYHVVSCNVSVLKLISLNLDVNSKNADKIAQSAVWPDSQLFAIEASKI